MKSFKERIGDSPINYFSDLFIVAMVVSWIATLIIMTIMGIYATIKFQDVGIWSDVGILAAVPLSAGGAIWMIKNAVVHYMSKKEGKEAEFDFPKIDDTIEIESEGSDSDEAEVEQ